LTVLFLLSGDSRPEVDRLLEEELLSRKRRLERVLSEFSKRVWLERREELAVRVEDSCKRARADWERSEEERDVLL